MGGGEVYRDGYLSIHKCIVQDSLSIKNKTKQKTYSLRRHHRKEPTEHESLGQT